MFKHIIVPIDGSDFSLQAVDLAASLAKEQMAACTVCTVVDIVPAAALAAATPDLVNAWLKTLEDQAEAAVNAAANRMRAAGVEANAEVVKGFAPDLILQVAREHHGDLIVMGSHGRSGLRRLFLGSVAESVLRTSPVPVLIVHGEEHKAKEAA
jgi:nucleotide-binding universal stress UspA family protein